MEIEKKYLVFLSKQNGPTSYRTLVEIIKTKDGYFFENNKSGYFQITKEQFDSALTYTLELMPDVTVQYSTPKAK